MMYINNLTFARLYISFGHQSKIILWWKNEWQLRTDKSRML